MDKKKKIHWSLSVQNPADNKGTFYPISLGGSLMVHPIKKKKNSERGSAALTVLPCNSVMMTITYYYWHYDDCYWQRRKNRKHFCVNSQLFDNMPPVIWMMSLYLFMLLCHKFWFLLIICIIKSTWCMHTDSRTITGSWCISSEMINNRTCYWKCAMCAK